jgi:cytidine deaminase
MTRKKLLAAAREAALHAYAPYSNFRVGAALLVETPEGPQIVTGANVENGSYGLTLCAERAALAAAAMLDAPQSEDVPVEQRGVRARPHVTEVAIACIDAASDAPDHQRTPCGACRQWLAELAPGAVYYVDGIERDLHLIDLLPLAFVLDEHGANMGKIGRDSTTVDTGGRASKPSAGTARHTSQRGKRE